MISILEELRCGNVCPTKVLSLGLEIVKLIISLFELTEGNVILVQIL